MTSLSEEVQKPSLDDLVTLFALDVSNINPDLGVLRFSKDTDGSGGAIVWDGETYGPAPIEADGFEWNSGGTQPQPKLKVSNILNFASSAVYGNDDLLGAMLTRTRTFRRFLDGEVDADPTAKFEDDIYTLNRKIAQNKVYIEWECVGALDKDGFTLPGRTVLRELCQARYRRYDPLTGDFDYSKASCPYTGANYYNRAGVGVGIASDSCGKRIFDCRLRFGQTGILPGWFFPGVGRIRV